MLFGRHDPFAALWSEMARVHAPVNRLLSYALESPQGLSLWEDGENFYAEADLPGVAASTLDVTLTEGNILTVQGTRTAPEFTDAVWHRQERPTGTFTRTVTLPALVDADKVEATLVQGVLRLTLPKSEAAKPRKISVRSN